MCGLWFFEPNHKQWEEYTQTRKWATKTKESKEHMYFLNKKRLTNTSIAFHCSLCCDSIYDMTFKYISYQLASCDAAHSLSHGICNADKHNQHGEREWIENEPESKDSFILSFAIHSLSAAVACVRVVCSLTCTCIEALAPRQPENRYRMRHSVRLLQCVDGMLFFVSSTLHLGTNTCQRWCCYHCCYRKLIYSNDIRVRSLHVNVNVFVFVCLCDNTST